jgi:hypothetical protein
MADIFTDAGEDLVADIMDGTTAVPSNWYVAWGTGAGTADKTDTTLFTEASESRVVTTDTQPSSNINQFVGTITADGTKTITNVGIFNASTSGTLLIHADHTGVGVNASDSIQYTIQLTWS